MYADLTPPGPMMHIARMGYFLIRKPTSSSPKAVKDTYGVAVSQNKEAL